MHLKVLACDLDGTLAEGGQVAAETWQSLRQAREDGLALVLVTGRRLETFESTGPFAELFEAIVAENGAAIYFPRNDSVILPFGRVAPEVVQRLEAQAIPLERGVAIVATWVPYDEVVSLVLRDTGGSATVEYNKGAVMVLPPGATKGTGLQAALHELGYSLRNVIACGDAENDRSLFEVSELSVAVANATPDIRALADFALRDENGAGVRALLGMLEHRALPLYEPREARRLLLGYRPDRTPWYLSPLALLGSNVGIAGTSGSGKSWLAGLLAEELLRHGYQVCIIDPEGDYRGLRAFPHTLLLGGPATRLPAVAELVTLSEYTNVSLILDLSGHEPEGRARYVEKLIRGLFALRARRGRPHWLLVDEAHYFCPPSGGLTDLFMSGMRGGGVTIVSYQPGWVAQQLREALDVWLVLRVLADEDGSFLRRDGAEAACKDACAPDLTLLPLGQAYVWPQSERGEAWFERSLLTLPAARRFVPHVRHLHKYLKVPLPHEKRFFFRAGKTEGPCCAASLWEFRDALGHLPIETIRYHLERGDFERWLVDVLHDRELARRVRKLAGRQLGDQALREALRSTVAQRYEELEGLL
jgi:hydroxymethylpyrimidine pyrophosphatase-like HAD family hydrolase